MSIAALVPGWIEEPRRCVNEFAAGHGKSVSSLALLDRFTNGLNELRPYLLDDQFAADRELDSVQRSWGVICDSIRICINLRAQTRQRLYRSFGLLWFSCGYRECLRVDNAMLDQLSDLARVVLLTKPEWNLTLSPDLQEVVWTVRITPLTYLRAMGNLFWSAIRHPFSNTTIDLSTGRVLYRT